MAAIWSAIKGAPDLLQDGFQPHQSPQQHQSAVPPVPAVAGSSSSRPTSSSRTLTGVPSQQLSQSHSSQTSQLSPRSPSSIEARSTPSPGTSATPQTAHALPLGKRTPSRLSRTSTLARKEWEREKERDRERDRERESDTQNADEAARAASTTTNITAGFGTSIARGTPPPPVQSPASGSAIDPLSQHIFMRTNTDHSIPQRLRHPSRPDSPTHMAEGLAQPTIDLTTKSATPAGDVAKDKRSFLSRFGMRGKKKDAGDLDSDSEFGSEARMDGINALVFSQSLAGSFAGVGYTPHHKEPPRYIRTKANNKKTREFNRMFLAQELIGTQPPKNSDDETVPDVGKPPLVTVTVAGPNGRKVAKTGGAIWATEFSKDGKYFATAGRDHVVRIWAVISTPEERRACEEEEAANGGTGERLSAPVFRGRPVREFEGHTGEVLDLSWSKNNFLLSSSMDKTVRLWHISRTECLCTFKHKDFVTRLAFHPRDDRFFLAGSLDTMLRLWSIPDKTIAFSAQLPDLVTAVAFSPDGKTAIAGLLNGLCLFFETEGLKFQSQIHVRSSRGKNAKGSKITSIQAMNTASPGSASLAPSQTASSSASRTSTDVAAYGDVRVLITSNDSRIRIYNLRDKTLDVKLKGHDNACSQIAASFSDDGNYVVCGSEDRKAFIWSLNGNVAAMQDRDKSPCEYFEAHGDMVTTSLFAPTRTKMLLGQSGDPIYDLCNPPPVVLRSLGEEANAAESQTGLSSDEAPPQINKPEPSPAYVARSTHYDGNIIVTTDDSGIIKVFRQDCAFAKRKHENWETGSTLSRKLTAHGSFIGSGLGRSASILTRTSASSAAHSRRGSLSQSIGSSALASPQLVPVSANSDRILSWRQSIEYNGDKRANAMMNGGGTPTRSERSVSPTKANRTPLGSSAANLASDARRQPYAGSSPAVARADSTVASPTASVFSNNTPERFPSRSVKEKERKEVKNKLKEEDIPSLPAPSFVFRPALEEDDQAQPLDQSGTSQSSSFWNLNRWRGITGFKASSAGQGHTGGHTRALSSGSLLSRSRMDGVIDERERDKETSREREKEKEKEKATRRQSVGAGVPHSQAAEEGDLSRRRQSFPHHVASLSLDGPGPHVDSDGQSIPTINVPGEEEAGRHSRMNPMRMRRDGSPYRHLWSRGNSSRLSSELSGDIEEEEREGDGEEMTCGQCGGREFKARKITGKQRLSCGRCGALVDE
ncbi:hypothetical protein B0T25DRAFT_365487 [Lasiosphaeria hispida]|uniref:Uncharacterized protein n=1 Tax=Lasiosphaeria hispida TaxID=260671 RepID=A0AAJ0H601_9PEZI|nr:hypothetical protein B0T25DRAFT_365487 [Lasiosphaeria hispida]